MVWVLLSESQDPVLVPEVAVWPVSSSCAVVVDFTLLLKLFWSGESRWSVACVYIECQLSFGISVLAEMNSQTIDLV